jgi:hypothetical protein
MSAVIAILILITVLVVGALIWTKMRQDKVGRISPRRKDPVGLQARVSEWLTWDAVVGRPDLGRYAEDAKDTGQPRDPVDRALYAVVLREALAHNLRPPDAYQRLRKRTKDPVGLALLRGKLGQATRTHWRRTYRGPDALYLPWYWFVAVPRHGRRQLVMETLSHALKEWRKS